MSGHDSTLHVLIDRMAVVDVLNRYARAVDTKDWDLLEDVFHEDLEADFRSFGGREIVQGRDIWVETVKSTIEGFDATQHLVGNHDIVIDGDSATMNAYLQAVHILQGARGDDEYTVGGNYDIELLRTDEGWRIRKYRLNVAWHRGNRDILRQALRRRG